MTEAEQIRFRFLCEQENTDAVPEGDSIGTYGEKRLHRILKRFVDGGGADFEVPIGRYIADVREGERITEIQTGSFYPLLPKLRQYLEQTECSVTVVYPIFADRLLLRIDPDTGEVLRKRHYRHDGRIEDVLPQIYWLRELLPSPRVTVRVLLLGVEEHRYSERVRYRRAGAYEAELFPKELLGEVFLRTAEDYRHFLPQEIDSFDAAFYAQVGGMKPRAANAALKVCCSMGLLRREKVGKKFVYQKQKLS